MKASGKMTAMVCSAVAVVFVAAAAPGAEAINVAETLKWFDGHVYGPIPPRPAAISFVRAEEGCAFDGAALRRQYRIVSENGGLSNAIDVLISDDPAPVLENWEGLLTRKPEVLTPAEKRAWLDGMQGVSLGSDAFFPFDDNIERARKSGVAYVAQPGGSIRDDAVIECCDKYGMVMAFTGMRLFHH